nr:hypothetical protein [uncultured Flavobacterium sp.]
MIPNIKRWLFVNLLITTFLVLTSCDNETQYTNYEPNYLSSIDATNLPIGNKPMTMFEDDENPSKMYDKKDRWFRVNEPLQIIQKGKDSVQVSLYSPVGLKDVKIYAKLPNYGKRFLIYHFTEIPAFHRSFHQIPLVAGKNDYLLETGNAVTIDKIDGFSSGTIEFSVESSDPLFAMFKKIKSSHLVQFNDAYHLNNNPADDPNKYLPMNPVLAKEAITMIINYSYALSHPIYYETFTNFDRYKQEQATLAGTAVNGAINWHANTKDVDEVYDYYTKAQIEEIYWNYLDNRTLYMAMVGGGSAWGGGTLASQWESGYVTGHWLGEMSVWSHEYSHHIGFNHDSNLANSGEGGGQQEMLTQFYKYLIHLNDLPFTNPDVLKGWTKTNYLNKKDYRKPVFTINPKNPFLLKYKGAGKWN